MWERRIKDMLIKVVLYQYGKYPTEKLDRELTEFLRDAEKVLCEAIRRNGGICYKELIEEGYTQERALDEIESQAKNFEMLGRTGKIIADLLRLSAEFRDLDKMSLSDKISLFDKIIHAEHAAGAFEEYLTEEKSIFGVDIPKIKEEADREIEEILEGRKNIPDPPKPPEKEPPERPFSELARKLAIEKLTYFTKAKALELGFSVEEANRIVRDLKDELTLLGTGIVTGDTTQEAAEREIEEGLRNLKRKKEEEERRKEEEKERKAPRMSKREALTRIKHDVEIALKDMGYRGVVKALGYIGPELEALAEDVARGQLSVEEAVKRAINLAKQYATPPKPGAPPAASRVEVRPEGFLSASEAADIIWEEYLGDLFNFGVRYVFENYMRERGMLEQDLGRVVGRLASKLRHLGSEMRKRGEETGIGRYIWVGKALTKYAPEIVQFGLLWAMRKIVPEIWPELRLFGNVVEALRETGIEESIAKALAGVVYDYLAIPLDKWPEDVRHCYEVFVEASRETSQPREGGERDLWRLYG